MSIKSFTKFIRLSIPQFDQVLHCLHVPREQQKQYNSLNWEENNAAKSSWGKRGNTVCFYLCSSIFSTVWPELIVSIVFNIRLYSANFFDNSLRNMIRLRQSNAFSKSLLLWINVLLSWIKYNVNIYLFCLCVWCNHFPGTSSLSDYAKCEGTTKNESVEDS